MASLNHETRVLLLLSAGRLSECLLLAKSLSDGFLVSLLEIAALASGGADSQAIEDQKLAYEVSI